MTYTALPPLSSRRVALCALGALCTLLAGCLATPPAPPVPTVANTVSARPAAADATGGFDWAWDVAGDPQVRPIQVFSNGQKTWLQMAPQQVMPALFVAQTPVPFELNPPYIMVVGTPDRIDLIAAGYRAVVTRRAPPATAIPNRSNDAGRLQTVPSNQIQLPQPPR